MSKEMLKIMRLLVPGVFIFLLLYPLKQGGFSLDGLLDIDTKNAFYLTCVFVLGAVYKTFEARTILFKESLAEVHKNIKARLLAPFLGDPNVAPIKDWEPRAFLKVFYNIVDNDPSLTEKTKDIYENGLLWSSYADLGVVSLFGVFLYLLAYYFTRLTDYLVVLGILVALFFFALVLIKISVGKHKKLSDSQLEVITSIHRARLKELLYGLSSQATSQ